jgi:hypothetical protein
MNMLLLYLQVGMLVFLIYFLKENNYKNHFLSIIFFILTWPFLLIIEIINKYILKDDN